MIRIIYINNEQKESNFKYLYFNEHERKMAVSNDRQSWKDVIISSFVMSDLEYLKIKELIKQNIEKGLISPLIAD